MRETYCAYSYYSEILKRTGLDWLIAVYETYFDDSGTNAQSDIAIAACYVSTESGWRRFCSEWDDARFAEGFEFFHMAEFVAPREHGHKPWCDWDNAKKDRVYKRLAAIINGNKRTGIACAVPKASYDTLPEETRAVFGMEHYTFAVRICIGRVMAWREKNFNAHPMQYFFDWENPGTSKRVEIETIFETLHPSWESHIGAGRDGYSFQRKHIFKPLQAADVLAWQMNNHMRKIWPSGEDKNNLHLCHRGFMQLRGDQEMDLGFFTNEQMGKFQIEYEKSEELRKKLGIVPIQRDGG